MIHPYRCAYLYRFKVANVGDRLCSPVSYFDLGQPYLQYDILEESSYVPPNINLIIGGGGILLFGDRVKNIAYNHKVNLIGWGLGDNQHYKREVHLPEFLNRFTLIGVRDYNYGFEWVPCVSCMHELFTKEYSITNEIGFFIHYNLALLPNEIKDFRSYPHMLNNGTVEDTITFLGSCEYVVTNSYHGAYWATLLNKKVIAYPNSSKFFGFKHPPIICDDKWKDSIGKCVNYSEALEECREKNIEFYHKVKERIKLRWALP